MHCQVIFPMAKEDAEPAEEISTGGTKAVPAARGAATKEFEGMAREDAKSHLSAFASVQRMMQEVSLETPEVGGEWIHDRRIATGAFDPGSDVVR